MKPVDLFHIGPQKSGSTWVYRCLQEHPQIATSPTDDIHYFDIHYEKGRAFYETFFSPVSPDQVLFDPSCAYVRSPLAPKRIADENKKAKIIISMRNPIDRAFSHYWHEKKKGRFNFRFHEVLENYDLFSSWVEPGFYAIHIKRYLRYFPREQILCLLFDDLCNDPESFYRQICEFAQIDPNFRPSALDKKINVAGRKTGFANRIQNRASRVMDALGVSAKIVAMASTKQEYLRGIDPQFRTQLQALIEPEIEHVEQLLGIDLSSWRTQPAT